MHNHDVNKLTEPLKIVQINRRQALRRVEKANAEEEAILKRIRYAKAAAARRAVRLAVRRANNPNLNNNYYDLENGFLIDDFFAITNNLWGERGTKGVVVSPGRRFVGNRTDKGAYHRRANCGAYMPR